VTLREFRKEFGDRAEPLNIIWKHRLDHGQWIGRRQLHDFYLCRGMPDIRSRMEHLGGCIVFDFREGDRECYRLTFLGVLLTADGPAIEMLLVRHLESLKGGVTAAVEMTPAETAVLSRVLDVADWRAGAALADLLATSDVRAHVESRALASYDPAIPIDRAFAE